MKRFNYNDWCTYWSEFKSLQELREKSDNIDDTLAGLEKECNSKLLAGDHTLIITALEERIEFLENQSSSSEIEPAGQMSLFAA